jgi:hypothetical protein
MDKKLGKFYYNLNPQDNGGETISLTVEFFSNGDSGKDGVYTNSRLQLNSYGNSAQIDICGAAITSQLLRKIADKLAIAEFDAIKANGG